MLSGLALLSPATKIFLNSENSIELEGNPDEFRFIHTACLKAQLGPVWKDQWGGLESVSNNLTQTGFKGLKIDSGDFINPGLPFSENLNFVQNLNEYGLHLAGLGKSELDLPEEDLSELLRAATFPVINTNYIFKNQELDKATRKHLIIRVGKYRLGVIAVADELGGIEKSVKNPIKTAHREAESLKYFRACDYVICLANLESKADSKDERLIQLAKSSSHIDFILDSNPAVAKPALRVVKNKSGQDVFLSRTLDRATYLGDYTITFSREFSTGLMNSRSRIPGVEIPMLSASLLNELSNQTA